MSTPDHDTPNPLETSIALITTDPGVRTWWKCDTEAPSSYAGTEGPSPISAGREEAIRGGPVLVGHMT